jgi:hypothetical protein
VVDDHLVAGPLFVGPHVEVAIAEDVLAGVFGGVPRGVEDAVHPEPGDATHLLVAFEEKALSGVGVRRDRYEEEVPMQLHAVAGDFLFEQEPLHRQIAGAAVYPGKVSSMPAVGSKDNVSSTGFSAGAATANDAPNGSTSSA